MGSKDHAGVGVFAERKLVVPQMGAVGGPHLDEGGPALRHDIRHPEPAADLNQLAAGGDDRRPRRDCGQRQQDGAGAVVDREAGLGAGDLGD